MAIDKGVPIPEGWALDKNGNPTTNAHDGGLLLPFGGFKGANLAMMMECLSGVVAAIDIATFTDVESYKENISSLIDGIKSLPKADGIEKIFVPGEINNSVASYGVCWFWKEEIAGGSNTHFCSGANCISKQKHSQQSCGVFDPPAE